MTDRPGRDLPPLGLGAAAFGGLYSAVSVEDALATLGAAVEAGIGYFDVAPMYGLGRAEHLVGHYLRELAPKGTTVRLSTKVGRLLARSRPGRELPPEPPRNPFDTGWRNGLKFREIFDYSYDGILRSFDDSQQRLGLPEIDLLFVHDIGRLTHGDRHDLHWRDLTTGGFRALTELRDAGLIRGFGLGVNETAVAKDAMQEADLDCCLIAGRYSLLDRQAEPLIAMAQARGVGIVIGGVFNSGILAGGPAKFDYVDAPPDIRARVSEMSRLCAEFGVPLGAAAVQFPRRNPGVTSVLVGARTARDVAEASGWSGMTIPEELWPLLEAV
ncbi:aldo/keto reductase [Roseibacterium sp. SDUM158017]|uniref:aldo/keto reductase n=1 Tax=Roseicyclus salinarum TaxID=3036773 RepID=UPI002414FF8B|nr:aldo/keto reductase [Roseibacterium sp. SDUM158017]MDG4648676.1 aldo/keto reductase [Roseibacterium sp. SDUM158017]